MKIADVCANVIYTDNSTVYIPTHPKYAILQSDMRSDGGLLFYGKTLSIKYMGIGFNPLIRDKKLEYTFDNVEVLQTISSKIKYDLLLGMNSTLILLNKTQGLGSE